MKQYTFQESLKWSNQFTNKPWWEEVYRKAFPNCQRIETIENDNPLQLRGIDRIIHTKSGKQITIDEKADSHAANNFFLEYKSCKELNSLGWIEKDAYTDYFAYVFVPSGVCYLLPFHLLQKVWFENKDEWIEKYGKSVANRGYTTLGCAVPVHVVLGSIQESLKIERGEL